MRILALGAHPDDIEISMFGAMAAWRGMGAALTFAIATDGAKGGTAKNLVRTRRAEAQAAADLLGADLRMLGFPDGELVPDAGLIAALKKLVAETGPDLIVTHAPNDYHGDHRALAQATVLASSFSAPVLHADNMNGVGSDPRYYVDITAHAELKAEAILKHRSQDPERFVAWAANLNGLRAQQCNAPPGSQAEAYGFAPTFPFCDIRALLPPAPPVRPVGARSKFDD